MANDVRAMISREAGKTMCVKPELQNALASIRVVREPGSKTMCCKDEQFEKHES
jgi:hypothetical protein